MIRGKFSRKVFIFICAILSSVAWDDGWQAWKLGKAHIDEEDIVSDYSNLENGIIISMEVF